MVHQQTRAGGCDGAGRAGSRRFVSNASRVCRGSYGYDRLRNVRRKEAARGKSGHQTKPNTLSCLPKNKPTAMLPAQHQEARTAPAQRTIPREKPKIVITRNVTHG